MNKQYTIIAGGGLSALMLARMIKLYRDPEADIIVVEKGDSVGGQYGSFNYGPHGYFDIGMHIFYESCIPEIDIIFTGLLPENEWNILIDNNKDIAGVFVNGNLQIGTPYVDLRNRPQPVWKKYVSEIFSVISQNGKTKLADNCSAYDVLRHHFGQAIADEIFVPVFEKLYLTHASNLDSIATHLTTVNRVALFDADIMKDLMKSEAIRARVCYPEQLSMPPYRTDPQRGFYPKKYGMIRVLEKLKSSLEQDGVRFFTSSVISNFETDQNIIRSLTVSDKENNTETFQVKELFWTAGLPSLAGALKIDTSDLIYDKKQTEAVYVNFLFDKELNMGPLYHFFCFDKGYRTFRVTNYTNFCPDAHENRGYPVCVELWTLARDSKKEEDITELAKKELKDFGVIDDTCRVLFSKAEKLAGGGFPLPSIKNIGNMNIIHQRIKARDIKNLIPTGVLSEKNVFFIKDVLKDTYKKVTGKTS